MSKRHDAGGDGIELVALLVLFGSLLYRAFAQPRKTPAPVLVREPGRACRCCSR